MKKTAKEIIKEHGLLKDEICLLQVSEDYYDYFNKAIDYRMKVQWLDIFNAEEFETMKRWLEK